VPTRDRALLRHKIITHGYFVRAVKPREHVREIVARLDLYRTLRPFTSCLRRNGELEGQLLRSHGKVTRIFFDIFAIDVMVVCARYATSRDSDSKT
jgi:uncharacterized protein with PIN domain